MTESRYDLIVIGAGPVGENIADRAQAAGLRAVVVEHELVGGECSYWACMPSKALLRSGAALRAATAVPGAAQAVTGRLDPAAVLARRDQFTSHWDDAGQVQWLASADIDLVRGHASIAGPRQVQVATETGTIQLQAHQAVAICTGSSAQLPNIPGLVEADPWTNREVTATEQVPASLLILGGGVVGCEMATAYADLGAQVTIVARSGVLARVEPMAARHVQEALRARGVGIHTDTTAARIHRSQAHVTMELDDGTRLQAEELLVATGRIPRTHDLGLDVVGIAAGSWLTVDETMRVTGSDGLAVDWLYAAGDVNHRQLLTHQGKYQARIAGAVIAARAHGGENGVDPRRWGPHAASADHEAATQVVFTDPQVATVGLTAAQAQQRGLAHRIVDVDLGSIAGAAVHVDDYAGSARLIVDTDRDTVLGVTFVGPDVAELGYAGAVAIAGEVPIDRLWHAIPPFPTMGEVWLRLLEADRSMRPHAQEQLGDARGALS